MILLIWIFTFHIEFFIFTLNVYIKLIHQIQNENNGETNNKLFRYWYELKKATTTRKGWMQNQVISRAKL